MKLAGAATWGWRGKRGPLKVTVRRHWGDTSREGTLSDSTGAGQRLDSREKRQRQVEWWEDECLHRGKR